MIDNNKLANCLPQNGRVVIHCKNGEIVSYRVIREEEHIASLKTFIELVKMAGYTVQNPDEKDV
jgi:hypothetical protein